MSSLIDKFSGEFADYPITSTVDYYFGYYEINLDKESRDLMIFLMELELVRMTQLSQGWSNFIAIFQHVMRKIHWRQIPHYGRSFFDNMGLKYPEDHYDDAKISSGTRQFVYEHTKIFR